MNPKDDALPKPRRLRGSMRDLENKRRLIQERAEREKMLRDPRQAFRDPKKSRSFPPRSAAQTGLSSANGSKLDSLRPFIERAAEVLLVAGKRTAANLRKPQDEAKIMDKEAEERIEEIGMVFDRNSKEILKFVKQNRLNKNRR